MALIHTHTWASSMIRLSMIRFVCSHSGLNTFHHVSGEVALVRVKVLNAFNDNVVDIREVYAYGPDHAD